MNRVHVSRLRQQLRQTEEARQVQLQVLFRLGTMIQGSFGTDKRRCGKPTCRCVTGALHQSKRLSRSKGGRTYAIHVPACEEITVAHKVRQYQRWRHARAALMKLSAQTAALADALQQALTEPYPVTNAQDAEASARMAGTASP